MKKILIFAAACASLFQLDRVVEIALSSLVVPVGVVPFSVAGAYAWAAYLWMNVGVAY